MATDTTIWHGKNRNGQTIVTFEGIDAEGQAEKWLEGVQIIKKYSGAYIEPEGVETTREQPRSKANSVQGNKAA